MPFYPITVTPSDGEVKSNNGVIDQPPTTEDGVTSKDVVANDQPASNEDGVTSKGVVRIIGEGPSNDDDDNVDPVSQYLDANVKDQPPLFIIGDILGRGSKALGEQLNKVCAGRREIYVYDDPRLENQGENNPDNNRWTLDQQAEILVNQMQPPPFAGFPILLVGYSYGCTLAAATVKLLKQIQYDPHLFLIDAPAPTVSKQFFTEKDLESTRLVGEILNYAANLTPPGLKSHNFKENDIIDIAKHPFLTRIEMLGNIILKHQKQFSSYSGLYFEQYMRMVKQNLKAILEKNMSDFEKVEKINLLITDGTVLKYGELQGGWEAYANEVNIIQDPKLQMESHAKLLSGPGNAERIANIIQDVFSKEVKKEDVFTREFKFYVAEYKRRNPEVDTRFLLEKILDELDNPFQTSSPSISPEASPRISPSCSIANSRSQSIEIVEMDQHNNVPVKYTQAQFGLFAQNEQDAYNKGPKRERESEREERRYTPSSPNGTRS